MNLGQLTRRLFYGLAVLAGVAVLLLLAVLVLQPSLDLSSHRRTLEREASALLGSPTTFGSLRVKISLWPAFEVRGLRIIHSDSRSFASAERVRLQLGLLRLLGGEVRIREVSAEEVEVEFQSKREVAPKDDPSPTSPSILAEPVHFEIDELSLRDVTLRYRGSEFGDNTTLELEELQGSGGRETPVHVKCVGSLAGRPFSLEVNGGNLGVFGESATDWPFEIAGELDDNLLLLEGAFAGDKRQVNVSEATGSVGGVDFDGSVLLSLLGAKPQLSGRLDLGTIDLTSWARRADDKQESGDTHSQSDPPDEWSLLEALDADVDLAVERILSVGPAMEALSLQIGLQDGSLTLPFNVSLANTTVGGQLVVDGGSGAPHLSLGLSTGPVVLSELDAEFFDSLGLAGETAGLDLEATSRGDSLDLLWQKLRGRLLVRESDLTYGYVSDRSPVQLALDELELGRSDRETVRLQAQGQLEGETFSFGLTARNLAGWAQGASVPIELIAHGAGGELELQATLDRDRGHQLEFAIRGERIGDLAPWLGVSAEAGFPYTFVGRAVAGSDIWGIELEEGQIGRTALTGWASWDKWLDSPVFTVDVKVATLDLEEIFRLEPENRTTADPDRASPAEKKLALDIPILPSQVYLPDADLHLTVGRLFRQHSDLTDLSLDARFRDGQLEPSPFALNLGDTRFAGKLALDLRGEIPEMLLEAEATQVDLGRLLARERLVEGLDITAERMRLEITAHGSTLGEALDQSELVVTGKGGRWLFQEPGGDRTLEIHVEGMEWVEVGGEPGRLRAELLVNEEPMELHLEHGVVEAVGKPGARLPVTLTALGDGWSLEVNDLVEPPLSADVLDFDITLEANRIDRLSALFGLEVPILRPFLLTGQVLVEQGRYSVDGLEMQVGKSDLRGALVLDTRAPRPRIELDLTSRRSWIDDFLPQDQGERPVDADKDRSELASSTDGELDDNTTDPKTRFDLTQFISAWDAQVSLSAKSIVWQERELGGGELVAWLESGRLEVDPLVVEGQGGKARVRLVYESSENAVTAALEARAEDFDYSAVAQVLELETNGGGVVSFDTALRATAPAPEELLASASGHLNLGLWPKGVQAGVIDVLGSGLVRTILPMLDSGGNRKLNCVAGRLTVTEGRMVPEVAVIDSTHTRAFLQGTIDLGTGELSIRLVPRPKKAELVSIHTPVRITGSIHNPSIGLTSSGTLATLFRFRMWLWSFFWRLTQGTIPADGSDYCSEIFQGNGG